MRRSFRTTKPALSETLRSACGKPPPRRYSDSTDIDGFVFGIETLYLARKLGYSTKEVGITWSHNAGSKAPPLRDGLRMLKEIVRIKATDHPVKR